MITERQQLILERAVADYLEHGRPVSSRAIAEAGEVRWGPSTVRAELAALESAGLLTHPHTSAGRVPTDRGYRHYVDNLLATGGPPAKPTVDLELSRLRHEIDETMRETTTALAQVTELVALVTAPPREIATIHRVEVLKLRRSLVMVVVITSTGMVDKKLIEFSGEVDRGLVEWASSYLNEYLVGMEVGARMILNRLADPQLGDPEKAFIERLSTAFTGLDRDPSSELYVEGASRLVAEAADSELPHLEQLMSALERRVTVLAMMRSALEEHSIFLWIGSENPRPELKGVSVVGANYGLGHRNLGSVGVVGPVRMDYATAITSVREAARELSHYFEGVYES